MTSSRFPAIAAILAAGLLAGQAQAAAVHRAAAPTRAELAKRAACEKVWAAQKVRHGTREAFVNACVAKG